MTEPSPSSAAVFDERHVDGVVKVHRHRHRGGAREGQARARDRRQPAVIGHAVLADLEHHRRGGGLGACDDRLRVLDADHVERADPAARGAGGPDDVGRSAASGISGLLPR